MKEENISYNDRIHLKNSISNGMHCVNKIPFDIFYKCLVNHFNIWFKKKTVQWPKIMSKNPKNI